MEESYENAIRLLHSRKASAKANLDDMRGSDDMVEWLDLLGYSVEHLNQLSVIHVAGTNGKGSTCAFISSFLKAHGEITGEPRQVGLYTSPHLASTRERIRINGEPISEKLFATRFFEIWKILPKEATPELDIPRYLQLLTLLSFHVFIKAKVDVVILETHSGGKYDATNIINAPLVTAISSISLDHVHTLGPTIEHIARHKAGIFKSGSAAFSIDQEEPVAMVLLQQAADKGVSLEFVGIDPSLDVVKPATQKKNGSLALAVVRSWLRIKGYKANDDFVTPGIDQFSWPGRYQIIEEQHCRWYLDVAHNVEGLYSAIDWFADATKNVPYAAVAPEFMLIFAHYSARDGVALLHTITESLRNHELKMGHVVITSYEETRHGPPNIERNLTKRFSSEKQTQYVETWKMYDPTANVTSKRTIEEAVASARVIGMGGNIQVLVIGDIPIVSGVLNILRPRL